jgi:hypothetical protein
MTGQRTSANGKGPLRWMRFSTERERPGNQFKAWRDIVASMTDVEPFEGTRNDFNGSIEVHDLDAFKFASFTIDPCHFRRTSEHVRKSGVDQWFLTVVKKGTFYFDAAGERLDAPAGSVCFNSFAYPFSGVVKGTSFTSLLINRDDFGDIANELDRVCHRPVTGPMSLILRELLNSVEIHLPHMGVPDVAAVNEALTSLIRAALVNDADTAAPAGRSLRHDSS